MPLNEKLRCKDSVLGVCRLMDRDHLSLMIFTVYNLKNLLEVDVSVASCLNSNIKCNGCFEGRDFSGHDFSGCVPSEGFSLTAVHQVCNVVQTCSACTGQLSSLGHELTQQTVGVFVAVALPGSVRIVEPNICF